MNDAYTRARRILEAAENSTKNRDAVWRVEKVELHDSGYAEPGYANPESGVVATGNWNNISHYDKERGEFVTDDETLPRVSALFEKLGIEIGWSDEWAACCECGKLVRIVAGSYGWTASYVSTDCGLICHECIDPAEHLKFIEGRSDEALTLDIDPGEHGYTKANDERYENGWYGGQNDDPNAIGKALEELGIERYLFSIDGVGQFDLSFSVWVHDSETHLLEGEPKGKCEDPADVLKRGLQSASIQTGEAEGDGIVYSKIHSDGTASTRMVSPEEFVNGIK